MRVIEDACGVHRRPLSFRMLSWALQLLESGLVKVGAGPGAGRGQARSRAEAAQEPSGGRQMQTFAPDAKMIDVQYIFNVF